ncbi:MAG: LacI family transcriptional regulator [Chloroflexi bacterium]|nr:LacI family transcriptional regulator [Chloroflexota bacterium]
MQNHELPTAEIAELLDRDTAEVEAIIRAWVTDREQRQRSLVPDLRLLANLSGLSTASVSNYLRHKQGSVSRHNAQRLASLIDQVGYVPSSAAQSLRGRETNAIGVGVPLTSVSPEFYLQILGGIKQEADLLGYQPFIFDVTTEAAREEFFGDMPFLGIVDGLIAVGLYIEESRLRILNRHNIPVVAVNNRLLHPPVIANVLPTDEYALRQLIDQHLIKHHGYRRLALVTLGTSNPLKMGESDLNDWSRIGRINAYKQALSANEIDFDPGLVFEVNEHSYSEGYRVFESISALCCTDAAEDQIEVVVCTSDALAAGILTAARRQNLTIPVTGFDNLPLAELLDITTVDQRASEIGRVAFRQICNALSYHRRKGHFPVLEEQELAMHAVIRSSCGCLPQTTAI